MGFLSNMADEAGKKTGKAIANKLFGRHADDLRIGIGNLDNDASSAKAEAKKVKAEGKEKRKELKLQEQINTKNDLRKQINEVQSMAFDTQNVKANINVMMQLASIIDSGGKYYSNDIWDDSERNLQKQLLDTAQSKFNMGINLCKAIDPTDHSIVMFEDIIRKKQEKEEEKKNEDKKNNKLFAWIGIGSLILFALMIILLYIFQ